MFKAVKSSAGSVCELKLVGSIDAGDNFETIFGEIAEPELLINCQQVKHINSIGVKNWMKYFTAISQAGKKFKFSNLSPQLVEMINVVQNFNSGGEITSVMVPFRCDVCSKSFEKPFMVEDIVKASYELTPGSCEKGPCKAEFDDYPEDYFAFIIKKNKK